MINKSPKAAPFEILLVKDGFHPWKTKEENREHILATYRGKVQRKFATYPSGVYRKFFYFKKYFLNSNGARKNFRVGLFGLKRVVFEINTKIKGSVGY